MASNTSSGNYIISTVDPYGITDPTSPYSNFTFASTVTSGGAVKDFVSQEEIIQLLLRIEESGMADSLIHIDLKLSTFWGKHREKASKISQALSKLSEEDCELLNIENKVEKYL